MNNDDFKNLYPIKTEKSENAKKPNSYAKPKQVTMINIGQIILICFLFIIIITQTGALMSSFQNSFSDNIDPKNDEANINANLPQFAEEININEHQNLNINNTDNANHKDSEIIETIFILGENNGKLAVLSPDGQTVYKTFDVYINTLPDYDKNLLQNGIKIKTAEELYSLLEDYNS